MKCYRLFLQKEQGEEFSPYPIQKEQAGGQSQLFDPYIWRYFFGVMPVMALND